MCGIYGAIATGDAPLQNVEMMGVLGQLLRHRGPDAHGIRETEYAAIGAERLRIYDPTPAGDQPFTDPSEELWVAVNGAIYNAPEIRRRYQEYPFGSRSDSEIVVPLYLDLGIALLAELEGMFAIAIYDGKRRELILARDRAGEKPLFYSRNRAGEIWFASEIQALLALPFVSREVDQQAVRDFVTLGYVVQPKTMFANVKKVGAGACLAFSSSGLREHRYWDPGAVSLGFETETDALHNLEALLSSAVHRQLTADVPVGIFSSGGVDSSLIAALACSHSEPASVNTFSVGFNEPKFDESPYAQRLASYLGTNHRSVVADRAALTEALGVVTERLAEPSADPAILPTYLLARSASNYVRVVLGGEGADELFGGYPTYLGHRLAKHFQRLPAGGREMLGRAVRWFPASLDSKVSVEYLLRRFLDGAGLPLPERHLTWFGTGAGSRILNRDLLNLDYEPPVFPGNGDPVARSCRFDYETYLRENLLTKMDRATMLNSIEARAPYLDKDVSAFGLAMDSSFKVRGLNTKWLMKQVALKWLPRALVYRRKRGLSVPVATWLNEGLKTEVDRLLDTERIDRQGLLHPKNVSELINEHRSGRADHGRALWALLMLEYWLENWIPETT